MIFNSISFLIFFPIVVCIYFLIPQKVRYIWLLVCSYYFYMCWNASYAILIALSTFTTWAGGLAIGVLQERFTEQEERKLRISQKWIIAAVIILNLGILFFYKYFDFAVESMNQVLKAVNGKLLTPEFDVLLPVGISFYTFQALSYIIDVYRKDVRAERNVLRYALFVSFFPQLVAGPIERSGNLLRQVNEKHYFDFARVKSGLMLMAWGFFQKLVISDRIAISVTAVYNNYQDYTGIEIVMATVLFAVQIYCDFAGYSDIAIGAAEVMGFELMQNFKSPYFSKSVSEFWRRWHISLNTWLRDYIYISLGGNRKGKLKKYCNIMITFLASGLWHGANWTFVLWGGLNGLYQVIGDLLKPVREKIKGICKVQTESVSYRLCQMLITFVLVDFAWLFFRADSIENAFGMIAHAYHNMEAFSIWNPDGILGITTLGLDNKDFLVMVVGIIMLAIVDYYRHRIPIRQIFEKQNVWFRWIVLYGLVAVILMCGVYGVGYDAAEFIYFQF